MSCIKVIILISCVFLDVRPLIIDPFINLMVIQSRPISRGGPIYYVFIIANVILGGVEKEVLF